MKRWPPLPSTPPFPSRRALLQALGAGALAWTGGARSRGFAQASPNTKIARRLVVFYFPDGIPAPPGTNFWHPSGGERGFALPDILSPLEPFKDSCLFFKGLSMGPTDSGSHPGGAKKLLTGVDGGEGESIDRVLARTVGADAPFRHVYLGAMATQNNASGDKYISYPRAGTTAAPEDSPQRAFQRLFGSPGETPTGTATAVPAASQDKSILDTALSDLEDLRRSAGTEERRKLDLHVEALRDLERRTQGSGGASTTCQKPSGPSATIPESGLFDPERFPDILRAQIDLMVLAMACGLTRVGVLQASQHTSELVMSRFKGTPFYRPNFDMRSHQASHYGQPSDSKFPEYVAQRKWFVAQFAYLLDELRKRPEGQGTMLDSTLVLLCSEVADGNTHLHDDMPFILAGGSTALQTGRFLDVGYRRHGDLLCTIAHALGHPINGFGQASTGPLPGVLLT